MKDEPPEDSGDDIKYSSDTENEVIKMEVNSNDLSSSDGYVIVPKCEYQDSPPPAEAPSTENIKIERFDEAENLPRSNPALQSQDSLEPTEEYFLHPHVKLEPFDAEDELKDDEQPVIIRNGRHINPDPKAHSAGDRFSSLNSSMYSEGSTFGHPEGLPHDSKPEYQLSQTGNQPQSPKAEPLEEIIEHQYLHDTQNSNDPLKCEPQQEEMIVPDDVPRVTLSTDNAQNDCDGENDSDTNIQEISATNLKPYSAATHINVEWLEMGKKVFFCNICQKRCSSEATLQQHQHSHTAERPYTCETCSQQFTSARNLQVHMRIHTGEKPYTCEVCSKKFTQLGHLQRHERTHTGVKPYSCNVCGKCFIASSNLSSHMLTHTGEKPFACDICGKCFATPAKVQRHMQTHSGFRPHSCETCAKSFALCENLQQHLRTHGSEKPFGCGSCEKRFTSSANLNLHMRSHNGEKPYSCKVCDARFARPNILQAHMRTHTGERPYVCRVCDMKFTQAGHLQRHTRIHTGDKPYRCELCQKSFIQSSALGIHMRSHKLNNSKLTTK